MLLKCLTLLFNLSALLRVYYLGKNWSKTRNTSLVSHVGPYSGPRRLFLRKMITECRSWCSFFSACLLAAQEGHWMVDRAKNAVYLWIRPG